mgnify:CR=1 FL=1
MLYHGKDRLEPTLKYYEWRAAEIFGVLPKVIRDMKEEDRAEHIAWAMIRHSEESEIIASMAQVMAAGRVAGG